MNAILLSGALGRMGMEIAKAAADYGFFIAAGVDVRGGEAAFPLYKSLSLCREKADIALDFSRAAHTGAMAAYAREHALPLVIGTTGLQAAQEKLLADAARDIPIFYSANFSLGAYILLTLAQEAARLCAGWDIEIIERHHRHKPDAPGGTAIKLYQAVAKADSVMACGRSAAAKQRDKREIGVHALRGGTLTGSHEIGYYGDDEALYLRHEAQSRAVFSRGALRAARFLLQKEPGLYGMGELVRESHSAAKPPNESGVRSVGGIAAELGVRS